LEDEMQRRAHIIVQGRVQGVGYRASAQYAAEALGLTGYVRNLPDGGVEIMAEGEADTLEQLVSWARRGPSAARVTDCQVEWQNATGAFQDFRVAL
jgi:acylphosphatase